ncbi:glycoside hydrolase family 3 N-terminal domain-containing protein [Catellatospora coxensis]
MDTDVRHRISAILLAVALSAVLVPPPPVSAAVLPYQDPSLPVATRVNDLMSRMTLDEKLGQMTQAERGSVTAADITTYRLGSILSGGGSAPTPNTATSWADMYDGFQNAALATPLAIPMIYGVDAVHGHNNVVGATIFPHNIGLGATGDPALIQQIGRAVAEEVSGTGIDWNFAPCLCVARNDRWGRTYESFGETPDIASSMTAAITGLQGGTLGGPASVLATAKHYLGDGGTTGGDDQGDTQLGEAQLRAIHLPPFQAAVQRGVGSVMVSYSSWNGVKLHGHQYLITTLLKGELGFTGFVVSDWNGIDQIDGRSGFTAGEVSAAINAGIDMVMVPTAWKTFLTSLRAEVQNGHITTSRVDDANRRILTKKFELGLFERPLTDRAYTPTVGIAAHRALARQAVARSQVLLKNAGGVLPWPATAARSSSRARTPTTSATSPAAGPSRGRAAPATSPRARRSCRASVPPSAPPPPSLTTSAAPASTARTGPRSPWWGDPVRRRSGRPHRQHEPGPRRPARHRHPAQSRRARHRGAGIGPPLDIAANLPAWNALLAAWLPGTEGGGVADVLFGAVPPTGKTPMTWMNSVSQQPINAGDGQTPLFAQGFGLTY